MAVDEERARRVGLNEAVFRSVNEELEALAQRFNQQTAPLDLVCECARTDCDQRIRVGHTDYERVRSDPVLFVVVPGHELPDVEDVVRRGDSYDVIRKRPGTPAAVARATDTRDAS